ncbi:bifunctional 4-hydroxy-2-oxoglutarate aldolase/2-dehydro-3-deoxy-phosphogluconate aldolase [Algoriphagus sp. AGSA1]|uniref:bifunctional 4-hydroxy-2-oxoglutarate aldolase/2-dehydro-3-deoxy-phosphogluconate aldolase n=1 Tax=Algoriphagus sp. AGSA1 TaxID=2907213 RepID=UPI001F2850BF|nr:bifunctional 4-hydroxy-2-oxoglutarate aldolase/2-dehydro-3-deoxy-phosphogluconate aldolase [Algoriphagus sp. AGSA1]MCE7053399.1 bifunctional 4-hydroxy-2-oxoglutarate aldolase/2-dehydro-3-deoxy-phosphogluconate aldolase [Algoriphagus sp. AGSA1]
MNNSNTLFWERYQKAPVVGISRGHSLDEILKIAEAYEEAGLTTLEITMNTAGASRMISALRTQFPALNIGAGTVCNLSDLKDAIDAGAQFIVTPIIDDIVITHAVDQEIPIFPGAFSPSEIYKAWSLGASAVKVFPATQLGVQYIKDVLAPLNNIKLLPTGGVSLSNVRSFFEAGAFGVGMGSSLFDKKLIGTGDFNGLKKHFVDVKAELGDMIKS